MDKDKNEQSLRGRVQMLAPLFRTSVAKSEAVSATRIPRSSVARIYKVFSRIESGLTDEEISIASKDFSLRTVAEIRSTFVEAIGGPKPDPTLERFLDKHRRRLQDLSARLSKTVESKRIAPWPTSWTEQDWPDPFNGDRNGQPLFHVETDRAFISMVEHLRILKLGSALQRAKDSAVELRECATKIQNEIPDQAITDLTYELVRAVILFGSQLAEDSDQEFPEISVASRSGKFALHINAFSGTYQTREEAEQGAAQARDAIGHVRRNPSTASFYEARVEFKRALDALCALLAGQENVDMIIDRSDCQICHPMLRLSQST